MVYIIVHIDSMLKNKGIFETNLHTVNPAAVSRLIETATMQTYYFQTQG